MIPEQLTYAQFVSNLVKSGDLIKEELTGKQADAWHMATGIIGEAGELIDAVKKEVVYQKLVDRENIIEELGDLEFYIEGLRQNYGITRDETIAANRQKLAKRYQNLVYTNQRAQDRADKHPISGGEHDVVKNAIAEHIGIDISE